MAKPNIEPYDCLLGFIIFTPTYKFNGQIADHLRRLDTSHVTPCKGQIPVASGQRHQKRVPTFHLLLLLQPDPIRYVDYSRSRSRSSV